MSARPDFGHLIVVAGGRGVGKDTFIKDPLSYLPKDQATETLRNDLPNAYRTSAAAIREGNFQTGRIEKTKLHMDIFTGAYDGLLTSLEAADKVSFVTLWLPPWSHFQRFLARFVLNRQKEMPQSGETASHESMEDKIGKLPRGIIHGLSAPTQDDPRFARLFDRWKSIQDAYRHKTETRIWLKAAGSPYKVIDPAGKY